MGKFNAVGKKVSSPKINLLSKCNLDMGEIHREISNFRKRRVI